MLVVKFKKNEMISCEPTKKYGMLSDSKTGQKFYDAITKNREITEIYIRTNDKSEAIKHAKLLYSRAKIFHD